MSSKAREFKVNGKTYRVSLPGIRARSEAHIVRAAAIRRALEAGVPLAEKLDQLTADTWNEEQAKQAQACVDFLNEAEGKLANADPAEGRKLAVEMRLKRAELELLTLERLKYRVHTVEAIADQRAFEFFVSAVTQDEAGQRVFKDVGDYLNRLEADDPVAMAAAANFSAFYGLDPDYRKSLPENAFLLTHKLCNEQLHLVDEHGQPVDIERKPVAAQAA